MDLLEMRLIQHQVLEIEKLIKWYFRSYNNFYREVEADTQEGADFIMVKPAMAYLDVIKSVSEVSNFPIVAYNVSGEYSMVKAAAKNNWIDEQKNCYGKYVCNKKSWS